MPEPDVESPEPSRSPDDYAAGRTRGGALGHFERLDSDGGSERWRYHPIGGGPLLDEAGNPCPDWVVTRPIWQSGGLADHSFDVVADTLGGTPRARFSYGPSKEGGGQLVSVTGAQNKTDQGDIDAWAHAGQLFSGVRVQPIPASDAAVLSVGHSLDAYLGTPDHPGPVKYALVPEARPPGYANSNSGAAEVANGAISRNPPPLNQAYLDPYPGSLSPGWRKPILGWKR